MTTADQFLAACASEIGYKENPRGSNRTKFAAEAHHGNGFPWCATFLVAIAHRTGLPLPAISASTRIMLAAFRQVGRSSHAPSRGAFAFFDFPDSHTGVQHVGCVESWTATTITSIDGNTGVASQDNGGEVARRKRSRGFVVAYGLPAYSGTSAPPPPSSFSPLQEDAMFLYRQSNTQEIKLYEGKGRVRKGLTPSIVSDLLTMLDQRPDGTSHKEWVLPAETVSWLEGTA